MMKPKIGKYRLRQFKFVLNKDLSKFKNDPYFIKEAERVKEKFLKYGIPEKLRAFLEETYPEEKKEK
jgi:hypothetical protein